MSAELYRGIAGSRVFVSCHVYESTAAIKQQYENPEFPAKLSEYPANIVSASQIKFGQVIPRPNLAPACEYVAIPDGSSSEAPVINPGPNILKVLWKTFCFEMDLLLGDDDEECDDDTSSYPSLSRKFFFLNLIL